MSLIVHTMLLSRNMDIGMSPLIWVDMKGISVRVLRLYHQKKLKSDLLLWVILLKNIPIKRSQTNLPTTCLVEPTVCQMDLDTVMRLFKIQLGILLCWENQIATSQLSGIQVYVHNSWKPPYWGVSLYSSFLWFYFKNRIKSKKIFENLIISIACFF